MVYQPLQGIRVLDLGVMQAAPHAASLMAGLGADVIKIESIQHPDGHRYVVTDFSVEDFWEAGGSYNTQMSNWNKRGITLNLADPRGADLFKRLVAISDVVIQNQTPRVMKNLGLDYPVLRQINPKIIYLTMPAYGMEGPMVNLPGWGASIDCASGISWMQRHPGGPPTTNGQLSDNWAGAHGFFAMLAALRHRAKTGEGQHIELAQLEAFVECLAEPIMDYTMNKRFMQDGIANRQPGFAPNGAYLCRRVMTPDRWVAISVTNEEQWKGFCDALGNPNWTKDERFQTMASRYANHDKLDQYIGSWTSGKSDVLVTEKLQHHGVPAWPLVWPEEAIGDKYFNESGFIYWMDRALIGTTAYYAYPFKANGERPRHTQPSPLLGEHNKEVLGGLLGVTDTELETLAKDNVIGNAPVGTQRKSGF